MAIKQYMKSTDYHLVVLTQAMRFKLFNAQGAPMFSGLLSLHPNSPAKYPVPSEGKCALAARPSKKYLHVSHLGTYKEPTYVDVLFTRPGTQIGSQSLRSWQDVRGVIYQMSDQDFEGLMRFAQSLDSNLSGAAMDKSIGATTAPVVYVSYA